MNCQLFSRARPKLMVISHERSGTHFLMNALARCFGYIADPWVNFDDVPFSINFFSPQDVQCFFDQFRGRPIANLVKSHHEFEFLAQNLPTLTQEFHIFYAYRDPRDTMVSYWRFLNQLGWHEGPKIATCKEFIRTEPAGHMLRYQYKQQRSMIHRWRAHVDGWMLGVPEALRKRVTFVNFADLYFRYDCVIRDIAATLGEAPVSFDRPKPQGTSILPGTARVGSYKEHFDADDLQLFRDVAGPTMDRLGFV